MSEFAVWAPRAARVRLVVARPGVIAALGTAALDELPLIDMRSEDGGWFRVDVEVVEPGFEYGFVLDGETEVRPDPRSRRQPFGPDGPSEVWWDEFTWHDQEWEGRGLSGAVIYELHIGTFTESGSLDGASTRLDHLVELGVTHVELMPVNEFDGPWNWGYDGVLWYAVHEAYGGPDALQRFVDACHSRGLAVLLDVVYNHLGAAGNHLPRFGPYLKSGSNAWGDLINLDEDGSEEVRRYIVENSLYWLSTFHIDGLRLDAIHALEDHSTRHVLATLSDQVGELATKLRRTIVLIGESDLNDPITFTPTTSGGWGLTAQWDDDVHHALHALVTGERQGYYVDFGSAACLAKVWQQGFFHDGTYSTFRKRIHGRPLPDGTDGVRLVASLQNHDQIGNRASGERLTMLTTTVKARLGALLLLTSPFVPQLFMGEEWAASTPWPYFSAHRDPNLAAAVSTGRIAEFAEHGWDVSTMLDPQDPSTYSRATLDWEEASAGEHGAMLDFYRRLLTLRREHPDLADGCLKLVTVQVDEGEQWLIVRRGAFQVVASLAEELVRVPLRANAVLLASAPVSLVGDQLELSPHAGAILH